MIVSFFTDSEPKKSTFNLNISLKICTVVLPATYSFSSINLVNFLKKINSCRLLQLRTNGVEYFGLSFKQSQLPSQFVQASLKKYPVVVIKTSLL